MSLFPVVSTTGSDLAKTEAALAKMATKGGAGGQNFIKFTKQGEWLSGVDADDITDKHVALNIASVKTGYIGWEEGAVKDEIMVLLKDEETLPAFEDLPAIPEGDSNGWGKQVSIEVKFLDNGDQGLAKGGSLGFRTAVSAVMTEILMAVDESGTRRVSVLNQVPVVNLGSGGYKHKKYGFIATPDLTVIQWLDSEGVPLEEKGEQKKVEKIS